jgi:hypothetical protein
MFRMKKVMRIAKRDRIGDMHIRLEKSERPTQGVAYTQFISFCVEGRAAIEVVQERKVNVKVVYQLHSECRLGCYADATRISQPRISQKLGLEVVAGETKHLVLKAEQSFHVLVSGLATGLEILVRIDDTTQPREDIVIGANQIAPIASAERCAK